MSLSYKPQKAGKVLEMDSSALFAVVLLHGLAAPADELTVIAAAIRTAFGSSVLVIQPHCRARCRSIYLSTAQQAQQVFIYIQQKIRQYKKEAKYLPLIIIGYSHGGIVATILSKRYRDQLHISGIVLITTPLSGVSLLARNFSTVKEFLCDAREGFQLIGYKPSWLYQAAIRGIWPLLLLALRPSRTRSLPLYGLQDLHPESKCIEEVRDCLNSSLYDIPTFVVATYQDKFEALFDLSQAMTTHAQAIIRLNHAFAKYITGNAYDHHDTLIALSSQRCSHSGVGFFSPYCHGPIVEKVYSGLIHAHNLVAINPTLFVQYGIRVIGSDQVLFDLVAFMKNHTRAL